MEIEVDERHDNKRREDRVSHLANDTLTLKALSPQNPVV
jgi:hypothetical protein